MTRTAPALVAIVAFVGGCASIDASGTIPDDVGIGVDDTSGGDTVVIGGDTNTEESGSGETLADDTGPDGADGADDTSLIDTREPDTGKPDTGPVDTGTVDPDAIACPSGWANCGGSCIDVTVNNDNCGGCGVVCTGQTCCNGACTALGTDTDCASCGDKCTAPLTCNGTSCACPSGQKLCSGACFDLATSKTNCGSCGKACPSNNGVCNGGNCECTGSLTLCGNAPNWVCTSLDTNTHCGSCTNKCTSPQTCKSNGSSGTFSCK